MFFFPYGINFAVLFLFLYTPSLDCVEVSWLHESLDKLYRSTVFVNNACFASGVEDDQLATSSGVREANGLAYCLWKENMVVDRAVRVAESMTALKVVGRHRSCCSGYSCVYFC